MKDLSERDDSRTHPRARELAHDPYGGHYGSGRTRGSAPSASHLRIVTGTRAGAVRLAHALKAGYVRVTEIEIMPSCPGEGPRFTILLRRTTNPRRGWPWRLVA